MSCTSRQSPSATSVSLKILGSSLVASSSTLATNTNTNTYTSTLVSSTNHTTTTSISRAALLLLPLVSLAALGPPVRAMHFAGSFLDSGHEITCVVGLPVDLHEHLPWDAPQLTACISCSCPGGYIKCSRNDHLAECSGRGPQLAAGAPKAAGVRQQSLADHAPPGPKSPFKRASKLANHRMAPASAPLAADSDRHRHAAEALGLEPEVLSEKIRRFEARLRDKGAASHVKQQQHQHQQQQQQHQQQQQQLQQQLPALSEPAAEQHRPVASALVSAAEPDELEQPEPASEQAADSSELDQQQQPLQLEPAGDNTGADYRADEPEDEARPDGEQPPAAEGYESSAGHAPSAATDKPEDLSTLAADGARSPNLVGPQAVAGEPAPPAPVARPEPQPQPQSQPQPQLQPQLQPQPQHQPGPHSAEISTVGLEEISNTYCAAIWAEMLLACAALAALLAYSRWLAARAKAARAQLQPGQVC